MNQYICQKLIEVARAMKGEKSTGKSFHVTGIIRQNKIVCIGWNNYNKQHPAHRFGAYENYKGFTDRFRPGIHSEISAIIKMGQEDLSGYSMVNIRINNNFQVAMSKCCPNCERVIRQLGLKRLFYTTNLGNFEELNLK